MAKRKTKVQKTVAVLENLLKNETLKSREREAIREAIGCCIFLDDLSSTAKKFSKALRECAKSTKRGVARVAGEKRKKG